MSNFDTFLADFARSGNRYNLLPRLTASGKASGMTAAEIVERIRAVGVHDRDRDVLRLYNGSTVNSSRQSPVTQNRPPVQYLTAAEREEARRRLLPKRARDFVATLRDYGRTTTFTGTATADIFSEEIRMTNAALRLDADAYRRQAARQLRAMFATGEKVWAGFIVQDAEARKRIGMTFAKTPLRGNGVFDAHELAAMIEAGTGKIPTHVSLNPVTGAARQIGSAACSFDCAATVAVYRHVLVEFDGLFDIYPSGVKIPSRAHIDTIAGVVDYAEESGTMRPIAVIYTGGKSIHVCLRVRSGDLSDYKRQTAALRDVFTSADNPADRSDTPGWDNAYTHIRLAGAIRPETGRHARLLWSNP